MKNVHEWKSVHLIGIGGISMSAVAKILLKAGVIVSGSDVKASELTQDLEKRGATVFIGEQDERNVPEHCDGVVFTSATRENNPERVAAKNRDIVQMTNFEWLGTWFKDKKMVLVTGTHGKSTTTALLGQMCIAGKLDPTVIVGSLVSEWADKNVRLGVGELVIIEGDEYAKHFLEFHPDALVINNIELDHTDIYPTIDDMRKTFERLLRQTKHGGVVIANGEDAQVRLALKPLAAMKLVEARYFGRKDRVKPGESLDVPISIKHHEGKLKVGFMDESKLEVENGLIGDYNGMNIAGAVLMARELGVKDEDIIAAVHEYKGIWRRMEFLVEKDGVPVYSDYGHHPTAVSSVIAAVREAYPDNRLVLCFQPHHKNRTRFLWNEFVQCFDRADVLVLCEIYDVPGRSEPEDKEITSAKLLEDVKLREVARPLEHMEYAADPKSAIEQTFKLLKPGDICVVMGAGDIDGEVRRELVIKN